MDFKLKKHHKFAFSLGHLFNDLCASMWFSYLLIFITDITGLSDSYAGYLLLMGQVIDAFSTPIIGYESDRVNGFSNYGKRKSWHLIGTFFVSISFTFLFLPCYGCQNSSNWAKVIYYSPFIILFQFGWASTQIAHMTLVSELTFNSSERVGLNSYRNAVTLFANILVYGLAWLLLNNATDQHFSKKDSFQFMVLMICVVVLGLLASIIFHILTPEHKLYKDQINSFNSSNIECLVNEDIRYDNSKSLMNWFDWLKEYQFYMVGFSYMFSRLINNISQIYWSFFLIVYLHLEKKYAAIIPLIIFITGFIISLLLKPLNLYLGRKVTYFIGIIITSLSITWIGLLTPSTYYQVFGPGILIGIGGTIILVTSLSMIADMIGNNTSNSAFVYGFMSFGDKLSSGIAVMIIQYLKPQCFSNYIHVKNCEAEEKFLHIIMTYVLLGFLIACLLFLIFLIPCKLGHLNKLKTIEENNSINNDYTERTSLLS